MPEKPADTGAIFSVNLDPSAEFPIETGKDLLGVIGPSGNLGIHVVFPKVPLFSINGGFSYTYLPVRAETSLSILTLSAGPGVNFDIGKRFIVSLFGSAGGFFGFFNESLVNADSVPYENQQGFGLSLEGGAGFTFFLTPYLSVGLKCSYINYLGFSQSIRASLGTSFHLQGVSRRVEVTTPVFRPVFPAYFKYYNTRELGSAAITNNERFPLSDVNVSLQVNKFMSAPRPCVSIPVLNPGESASFDLLPLFEENVLENKENADIAASIMVEYKLNGRKRSFTVDDSLKVWNRNAITWDDDRKAACFVNPRAPEVLQFSKNIAGIVHREGPAGINQNLRLGMALFEALGSFGINYVIDPNTPSYVEASGNETVVDFLQYPNQTLSYKAGDCDDLSILYASLLESVGIDTAFITIPGHIYLAFSLDTSAADAAKVLSRTGDLIAYEDTAWVPVEITMIGIKGFLEAWKQGARSWREASGDAGFYPVSAAWQTFEAGGIPKDVKTPDSLNAEAASERYKQQLSLFVGQELNPQIASIKAAMGNDTSNPKLLNKLAILYAVYGMESESEALLLKILEKNEYVPALINLGNLYLIQGRPEQAVTRIARADELMPGNTGVLLNLARAYYDQGMYASTRDCYEKARAKDPALAERYAFLGSADSSRAADLAGNLTMLYWEVE